MEDISKFLDVNISCDATNDAGKDTNSVGDKQHTAETSADNQQKSGDGDMNDSGSDGDRDGEKNKLCRIRYLKSLQIVETFFLWETATFDGKGVRLVPMEKK